MRRKATSAVVSSSTPGVLHTATPRRRAASTSMLSYPTATLATTRRLCSAPAREDGLVDAVGEQAHEGVDGPGQLDQLGVGVRRVARTLDDVVTPVEERVEPPVGEGPGYEDAGHGPYDDSAWCSRSVPTSLTPMAKQKQWMGAWSLTGRRLWTLSGGMWTRSPWTMSRSSPSMVMMPRPEVT